MSTELKDELQQRNLPITDLKDDLVKRLSEEIQHEENTDGETPPDEGLKRDVTPGSVDVSVCQASGERNVDEGVSEVMKQVGDVVISVTESINESLVPTTKSSKESVVGTSESSQRTLDAVTEIEFSLVDMAATDENRCEPNIVALESASRDVNYVVKELNPQSEYHNDIIERAPQDDTSRKIVGDGVPSGISGINIKLGVDEDRKMLETSQDAVIGTAEAFHRAMDAVVEAEFFLDDMSATDENHCQSNGVGLESFSSGVTTLKEVDPLYECHSDTIDETPEDETNAKMAVVGVSSHISSISIKLTQEAFVGSAEASQKTLDAVTEVGSSLVDRIAKATDENHCEIDGVDLESESIGNTTMEKVNPHSEGQGNTIEKNSENSTSKKMVVDDVPSDVTSINTNDDVDMKLLEQVAVPTPHDAIALHADNVDVATALSEPEDYTGKEMAIDDVSSDVIHANSNSGVDVDCKSEQELQMQSQKITLARKAIDDVSSDVIHANANLGVDVECKSEDGVVPIVHVDCNIKSVKVPPSPDAIALHVDVVTTESMILKNSFSENALMNDEDYKDSKHTNGDCKLILCGPEDQVSEVKLDIASQTKCVSVFHDNVSTNEKNNVLGNNSDLELEAKKKIVNPFFIIPSVDDYLQALDGDNKLHKNGTMEESRFTSTMDLDTIQDSLGDNSAQSRDDESMDEDLMEKMHDTGGKTSVTSEHVFKEVTPVDTIVKGSSGHTKEVMTDEKPPNLIEKRKSEDTVNISDQKASKLTGTGAPKYSSVEEAVATRNAVYNLQWPPNNGSCLVAEFVDSQEVKLKVEPLPPSPVPVNPSRATTPEAATCTWQRSYANQTITPHAAAASRGLLPTPAPLAKLLPTSETTTAREKFPPPRKNLEPALKLDDLFKKTQAYPRIYYMPLSEKEALAKNVACRSTRRNRSSAR
ncbi:hypothetical protein PR202_gb21730 [Eleusine coracana subsp. coracana]|uniref:SAP domain-containing protein n=1 Tax=Eleusine coracana subsp. coracana TaxID=191504 RepID=A0AAV5FBW2_ELECO|nr:hypothetical protein PR202_gb21730 [Eleusine coracana subsp. coracana]